MKVMRNFALLAVLSSTMCFADAVQGTFNLDSSLNPIPSVGTVSFVLQGNGTISASLTTSVSGILGFGYDSTAFNLPESNFSNPGSISNTEGWQGTAFGGLDSGFAADGSQSSYTFTIGTPGEFSSVFNVLNAGSSTVNFFLFDSHDDQFGAQAVVPGVPEPGTLLLLATGGLGMIGAVRRRLA